MDVGEDGPPAGHDRDEERGRRPARPPQRLRPRHPRRRGDASSRSATSAIPAPAARCAWQIEAAITERTAAVACPILDTPGTLPLPEVAEIAHAQGVPVIVDAAAELPPRSNLRRFIAEGADLVVFSGGKAIGGPQASGILAGRADLIASVALQHQDMDVRAETWSKRALLDAGRVGGVPHQGFGRAMKVGREEIVGLITALERLRRRLGRGRRARAGPACSTIVAEALGEIDGVDDHPPAAPPSSQSRRFGSTLDEDRSGVTATTSSTTLLDRRPADCGRRVACRVRAG